MLIYLLTISIQKEIFGFDILTVQWETKKAQFAQRKSLLAIYYIKELPVLIDIFWIRIIGKV